MSKLRRAGGAVADVPVNEWRLLEIERLLRDMPSPAVIEELRSLSGAVEELTTQCSKLVERYIKLDSDLETLVRQVDCANAKTSDAANRLGRGIYRYHVDRIHFGEGVMLEYYGLGEPDR